MSSIFTESFESTSNGTALSTSNTTFTTAQAGWTGKSSSPAPATGLGSLYAQCSVAASTARYMEYAYTPAGVLYLRMYCYVPTAATGNVDFAAARGAGNTAARARMGTNSAGTKLIIRDNATTVYTSTASIPTGAWFRVEWRLDSTAGQQQLRLFLGANLHGSTPDEDSGNQSYTQGTVDTFRIGPVNNTLAGAWVMHFDAVKADNATWVGSAVVSNVAPTCNAGTDQTGVEPFSVVTLSGTDADSDGTIATRAWSGTGLTFLTGQTTATATAKVRGTIAGETITVTYTVTDNSAASTSDTLTLTVLPVTERAAIGGVLVPLEIRAA